MKRLLAAILNSKKKPVKVTGIIICNPENLKYIISTKTGKMLVQATVPYNISDRVVVYDNLIQGFAGVEKEKKSGLV